MFQIKVPKTKFGIFKYFTFKKLEMEYFEQKPLNFNVFSVNPFMVLVTLMYLKVG